GAAAAQESGPLRAERRQVVVELQHESTKALIGYEEVRAGAHHSYRERPLARPVEEPREPLRRARAGEPVGRSARANGGQALERIVLLDALRRGCHRAAPPAGSAGTGSTSPSAAPNSRARRAVREKRWGWRQAIRRSGSSVRAASMLALTSVGWWA